MIAISGLQEAADPAGQGKLHATGPPWTSPPSRVGAAGVAVKPLHHPGNRRRCYPSTGMAVRQALANVRNQHHGDPALFFPKREVASSSL